MPSSEIHRTEAAMPPPIAALTYGVKPQTMLLVEDSRFAAEAVRLVCRRAGIRLRRAETLASAELHLKVYRPDVAVIDLGLPDGSGLDLIAELATTPTRPHRIIAVSGDAQTEDDAIDAGADMFLLKPITLSEHFKILAGACSNFDPQPQPIAQNTTAPANGLALRNWGADPLALRDDLRLVCELLTGPRDEERLRYAGQFLSSIASSLADIPLARAAHQATKSGDRGQLVDLARARIQSVETI